MMHDCLVWFISLMFVGPDVPLHGLSRSNIKIFQMCTLLF
jgi:hypothetical protein